MRTLACVLASFALSALAVTGCSGANEDDAGSSASGATARVEHDAGNAEACSELASGPFAPVAVFRPFQGSEDFAFDGKGNIVARRGNDVAVVDAQGQATRLAAFQGQVYGLRYHPNGSLIAALPGSGALVQIGAQGELSVFATGLGTPNGVYVDFDGNVWVTEFGANKVTRIAPDQTRETIVSGPEKARTANGVVVNDATNTLFYTEYAKGKIHRVDLGKPGSAPVEVATVPGAALDGIVLDACGNIYAVDQGGSKLYRVRLGADGDATQAPELLASFPANVANAQFGSGVGFDSKSLYVTGNPGVVFSIPVGIEGAKVPAAPSDPVVTRDAGVEEATVDAGR